MKPKQKRCVISLRISQDRDDQHSTANQERESRDYAARKGWEVVGVYTDLGKSGYKPGTKRPGFDKAMQMIETKQAEVFLVWKISRFTRQIRQFHLFLNTLVKAGGIFDSVTDDVDYTSASGELLLAMVAGFAQMESAAKADFTKSWNDGRVLDGAVPQGPRPLGYDRLDKDDAARDDKGHLITLVVNSREAEAISYAAEQLLKGATLRGVMKDLGSFDGTKNAKLTSRGLRQALLNPTTAGLRAVKDVDDDGKPITTGYVQGCWEAILDRKTWDRVGAILKDPARRTNTGTEVRHLLTGIMVCPCGGKFSSRKWKQKTAEGFQEGRRYTCFSCYNSAGQSVIDDAVTATLLKWVDQPAWVALKEQGRGYDPEVIQGIEADQLKLAGMFKAREISMDVFQMMNEELVQRLAQATGAEPLDLPEVKNLAKEWKGMNVLDQRRVINVVFSQIKLDPANGTRDTLSRLYLRRAV